ncbi:MAG: hypothetical protein ACT4N8_06690 [Sphingosinicella sp.]|uniref:hypothetical protein n=1 Tax=Sphingosinicella sp. TaxID=1917971 RepID=UPI0040376F86
MDRLLIAWLLIVGVALAVGLGVAFKLYHSRERSHARRKRRETARHQRRMAERALPPAAHEPTR